MSKTIYLMREEEESFEKLSDLQDYIIECKVRIDDDDFQDWLNDHYSASDILLSWSRGWEDEEDYIKEYVTDYLDLEDYKDLYDVEVVEVSDLQLLLRERYMTEIVEHNEKHITVSDVVSLFGAVLYNVYIFNYDTYAITSNGDAIYDKVIYISINEDKSINIYVA